MKSSAAKSSTTKGATKRPLGDDALTFIQEFSALLAPWGLPPSAGRVYGYLLLQQEPVSLDQIAVDLNISKAGTWSVAREMESFGHIRRYSVPGSKRALFAPSDNFALPIAKQASLLGEMGTLLYRCASTVATEGAASQLEERAQFYQAVQQAMIDKISELNAQRAE